MVWRDWLRPTRGWVETRKRSNCCAESSKPILKTRTALQLAGELLLSTDPKTALTLLERADAVQPSAHGDLLIAHAYERLGQPDEATRYINQAKSRGPHDPDVLRAVAEQYRNQGKYDEAIATLQAIPNKNADVQAEMAYTYQLAGNPQEAATLYARVAKAAKGNIGFQLSAAQAFINAGKPEEATPFLDAARAIDGNNYRLHAILAALAESEDRLPEAEQEYKTALSNLPARVQEGPLYPIELRLNLYEIYVRQGDDANAKQQLQAAAAAIQQVQVSRFGSTGDAAPARRRGICVGRPGCCQPRFERGARSRTQQCELADELRNTAVENGSERLLPARHS